MRLFSSCLAAITLASAFNSAHASSGSCEQAASLSVPGFDYTATASAVEAGTNGAGLNIPAHCRVEGEFEKRTGADGREYAIRFALLLPDDWNGRFLFQGGGGLNGVLHEPLGHRFAGSDAAISRGFAVVSTDSGHHADKPFDPYFLGEQQALLNFLYQANEKVTRLAKGLVSAYYERAEYLSYFVGCSTGGREAMLMSQHFPTYFNGIVAGAPAMRTNMSELGDRWNAIWLRHENSDGSAGEPIFNANERTAIVESVIEACDANDGVADRMIFDVEGCDFEPADMVCNGEKNDSCLTAEQASRLATAFSAAKTTYGHEIYSRFAFDTGINAHGERTIPGLLQATGGPLGHERMKKPTDWDADLIKEQDFALAFGNTSEFEQLSGFSANGGKLIFYHGVSDPWFSAYDTVRYFDNMLAVNGGAETVDDWSRLFLNPGVGHCQGGEMGLDQVDLLSAIVDWVEQDKAPERIVASGNAFPGRTRALCPYPAVSRYQGGDTEEHQSFTCTAD